MCYTTWVDLGLGEEGLVSLDLIIGRWQGGPHLISRNTQIRPHPTYRTWDYTRLLLNIKIFGYVSIDRLAIL